MSDLKLNVLVAYPYWKKEMTSVVQSMPDTMRLLIDSGAFTAWRSGKPIDKKDYADFIDNLSIKPWRYFSLDVIGDAKRTQENLDRLIQKGYEVCGPGSGEQACGDTGLGRMLPKMSCC